MPPSILLAIIGAVPVVLALLLRVNAVFFFLSVAAGSLLVANIGDDASLTLGMMMRNGNTALTANLGLQLLPVMLTILFLKKTLPRHKIVLHVVPIIVTGLSLSVLVLPYLPSSAQREIFTMPYGNIYRDSQDVIVAAAALMVLVLAWISYRSKDPKSKRK